MEITGPELSIIIIAICVGCVQDCGSWLHVGCIDKPGGRSNTVQPIKQTSRYVLHRRGSWDYPWYCCVVL